MPLNIVHLSALDTGGAGGAALRLHLGLLGCGVNSTMLVLQSRSGAPNVQEVPVAGGAQGAAAWQMMYDKWKSIWQQHPQRPEGMEFFTDTASSARLLNHPALAQADIVNLHWVSGLLDVQTLPAILTDKRIIWTLHDQNPFTGGCHYAGNCRRFETHCQACPQLGAENENDLASRQWRIKHQAYRHLNLDIVTPSRWLAESARSSSLFRTKHISVIPNGLPLHIYSPRPTQAARRQLGLTDQDFVIMFGAEAHTRRKGFEYIRRLLQMIPAQLYGKRMVAAAFGQIQKGLATRVPLLELGYVKEAGRLAELYSLADVYVLPALEDNLPNTVLEAIACGTPVVGFHIGGIPDMVIHEKTGWLAASGDVDGLLRGLIWALKHSRAARERAAAYAREHFSDTLQARRYLALYQGAVPGEALAPTTSQNQGHIAEHFAAFVYARQTHFTTFRGLDTTLYGRPSVPDQIDLKWYQNLLVLAFIRANIPAGSRILEAGGGNSRILAHLAQQYECWNVDKFEGLGSGPTEARKAGYRIVFDYMGAFNRELPDNYFDCVVSISALEHTPNEPELYSHVLNDINRVLKPEGWSLHCFDVVFNPEKFWTNPFLPYLFEHAAPVCAMPDPAEMERDPDLYVMSRAAYNRGWAKITGKSYEDFGRPTSINILWRKSPARMAPPATALDDGAPEINGKSPTILVSQSLPTISIVTPSFNQGVFLEECIDSILSQGYPKLEYVIMDGGSTDGSVDIIKKYARHLTYWQSRPDGGQYQAVNDGFRHTSGEIMAWLNSDDKYHAGALHKVAFVFSENPGTEWIMGRPTAWNEDGSLKLIFDNMPCWSRQRHLSEWPKPYFIQQESVFWRRSLWNRAGASICTDMSYAGDFELWTRFFRHAQLFGVNALLGGYRFQSRQKVGRSEAGFQKYLMEAQTVAKHELSSDINDACITLMQAPPHINITLDRYKTVLRENGYAAASLRIASGNSVTVFTSLFPRDLDRQHVAVKSWQRQGLNVVSLNSSEEIRQLQSLFTDVEFAETSRTGNNRYGKPLVYFDDIIALALERRDAISGIINSDIVIHAQCDLRRWLLREAKGAFVFGRREDVNTLDSPRAKLYPVGFDCFFFDRTAAGVYPPSDFCLGVPWWDYWAPLLPLLHGVRLKSLNATAVRLLHIRHNTQWSIEHWRSCGVTMIQLIAACLHEPTGLPPAKELRSYFMVFFQQFYTRLGLLFETKEHDIKNQIQALRILGRLILKFLDKHTTTPGDTQHGAFDWN